MKKLLISKILDNIPSHLKAVTYLRDTLDIGRESAYRRMRGEIPFTFEEVAKLSTELGFSVDEIIDKNHKGRACLNLLTPSPNSAKTFLQMLQRYSNLIARIKKEDNAEILMMQNRIPLLLLLDDDILFRFYYYNFLCKSNNMPAYQTFAETDIPSEIMLYRNQFISQLLNIHQFTFIINRNFFSTFCREIQFCYNRKLITDEEVSLLKNALYQFLDKTKKLIETCHDSQGTSYYYFYLSFLEVGTNTLNILYKDTVISLFWIFSTYFIDICDSEICTMHKNWFETMKKYTVLISGSNELFQANFFDEQEKYIKMITDVHYFS